MQCNCAEVVSLWGNCCGGKVYICFKLMRKEKDRMMSVKGCKEKTSMIAAVAERSRWPKVMDSALECGGKYTKCVQALTRLMKSTWKVHNLRAA